MKCVAAFLAIVVFSWATSFVRAQDVSGSRVAKEEANSPLSERLGLHRVGDHILRGDIPCGDDLRELLKSYQINQIILLAPDNPFDAADRAALEKAGVKLEVVPILEDPGVRSTECRLKHGAARKLVDRLAAINSGKTYLAAADGKNVTAAVQVLYRMLVSHDDYATAMLGAIVDGFDAPHRWGLIMDIRAISAGIEVMPRLSPQPMDEEDLTSVGEMISAAGYKVNVKTRGDGTPVYAIHGGPGESHKMLRPYLDFLAENHTLVYYDQRGCGHSAMPLLTEAFTFDKLVEELESLRMALGHQRISLIGHSSGGIIALKYALVHPDRVDRLVLMNIWASAEEFHPYIQLIYAMLTPRDEKTLTDIQNDAREKRRLLSDAEYERIAYVLAPYVFFGRPDLDFLRDWKLRSQTSAVMNRVLGQQCFVDFDIRPELQNIKAPTLIISGKYDVVVPPSVARTLAEMIPNARFEVFEFSGHAPFVEQPEKFQQLVGDFLK